MAYYLAKHKLTRFENEYGCRIDLFANAEGVTPEAVWMRLKHFGSPYQRRLNPTTYELKYARTCYEIAEEQGVHPLTIQTYERKHKNAFYEPLWKRTPTQPKQHWREAVQTGKYWHQQSPWLHPLHPEYDRWRSGSMFPEEYVGGSKLSTEQIETLMSNNGWKKYV